MKWHIYFTNQGQYYTTNNGYYGPNGNLQYTGTNYFPKKNGMKGQHASP